MLQTVDAATAQRVVPEVLRRLLAAQQVLAGQPLAWTPLPHQIPPPAEDGWLAWVLLAGRGTGKTAAGAHYWDTYQMAHPGHRLGILAPTLGIARTVCVEGETGLLNVNPAIRFNRSWGELLWPNGARAQLFGASAPEDAERLRGQQWHGVWLEEFAAWAQLQRSYDMMRLGLRLGDRPHMVITTTPKPRQKLLEVLADARTVVTTAHTDDNPYLAPDVRAELYRQYGGTRLGEQELAARILLDVPGALWQREWLDAGRVNELPAGGLVRLAVAVDPEAEHGEQSAETGIIVVGKGTDGHGYVLEDGSLRGTPAEWASAAVAAYHKWHANVLVAETNQGGEMVRQTIASVPGGREVVYKGVRASHSKQARAEPIAALSEQGRLHMMGTFPILEDSLCSWVAGSGPSPDRLDAMVWACSELLLDVPASPFAWLTDDPAFQQEVLGHVLAAGVNGHATVSGASIAP